MTATAPTPSPAAPSPAAPSPAVTPAAAVPAGGRTDSTSRPAWSRFPDRVNEASARFVAAGVVGLGATYLATRSGWVVAVLAYGFAARVAAGPTFSPLAQFVTRVVTPRLAPGARSVAGPPKRFAQGIGATLSAGAAAAHGLGHPVVAAALAAMIVGAASLEAVAGYCVGCRMYALLVRVGIVSPEACPECADISRARGRAR